LTVPLYQRAQTRGPREGPMQLAKIRKNGVFKRNIGPIGLFSQKQGLLTQKLIFLSFLVLLKWTFFSAIIHYLNFNWISVSPFGKIKIPWAFVYPEVRQQCDYGFFNLFFSSNKLGDMNNFSIESTIERQRISLANLEKEELVCIFSEPYVILQTLEGSLMQLRKS